MKLPSSLRGGVHGMEDAIITLSGPGIAVSGIIAGVDLLTGGHVMSGMPWLATAWAICLLLSLDFQVLALGARSHKVYLSQKSAGRKAAEILLALAIAAAISYVSIQMQSIVAKMTVSNLSIDAATTALGIDPNALIYERSVLVLVLIFLSGWFRHESPELPMVNQVRSLEDWFTVMVQMNQGMLHQVSESLLVQLANTAQSNQAALNQAIDKLTRFALEHQESVSELDQRLTTVVELAQMNQQSAGIALAQDQLTELVRQLSQRQQGQLEAVFSRCIEQVFVREERPGRSTNPRMRSLPAAHLPSSSERMNGESAQSCDVVQMNQLSSGASEGGTRVLNYLDQCRAIGSPEPSLSQIEQACQVSHNTAINWRRQWRERTAVVSAGSN